MMVGTAEAEREASARMSTSVIDLAASKQVTLGTLKLLGTFRDLGVSLRSTPWTVNGLRRRSGGSSPRPSTCPARETRVLVQKRVFLRIRTNLLYQSMRGRNSLICQNAIPLRRLRYGVSTRTAQRTSDVAARGGGAARHGTARSGAERRVGLTGLRAVSTWRVDRAPLDAPRWTRANFRKTGECEESQRNRRNG